MTHNTLARSTTISHPASVPLNTPLLLPSFSSCAFGGGASNLTVAKAYGDLKNNLSRVQLVSAYDLHFGFLPPIVPGFVDLTFVDSGGYEALKYGILLDSMRGRFHSDNWDEIETKVCWHEPFLVSVIHNWPDDVPAVFVSFDKPQTRRTVAQQIAEANRLFAKVPKHLHTLLIKPTNSENLLLSELRPHFPDLRQFHVLGVTEKELGKSVLGRMKRLAQLRLELDECGIDAPIHIFGGLDPVNAILYFLSGAEIMDGLSWLRYGYQNGHAVYFRNCGLTDEMIEFDTDTEIEPAVRLENIAYMGRLAGQMRAFLHDGNYEHFGVHHEFLRNTYRRMKELVMPGM